MSDALSHAEWSRTLLANAGSGALSTLSLDPEGYPYASLVQYALTAEGDPLLLLSDLAEHTQNFRRDARASLLVCQAPGKLDPLAAGRVTVVGTIETAPDSLEDYLQAHPQAKPYAGFKDFHMWRLKVLRARYVGGFGEMSWVDPDAYREAQADPVFAFSERVIEHMNEDHMDALLLLAARQLGREVEKAEMVACDGLGYRIRVDDRESVRIGFAERLTTSNQVRLEFIRQLQVARG